MSVIGWKRITHNTNRNFNFRKTEEEFLFHLSGQEHH